MVKMISKEISCLDHMIKSYAEKDNDFKKLFNITQFHVLMYLQKHIDEDICQKDLEAETNLKKASITGVIDSLVEKGFVQRVEAKDDRRKNYIKLTQKATDLKMQIKNNVDELNKIITKDVSKEEIETFLKVLEKFKANLQENCK